MSHAEPSDARHDDGSTALILAAQNGHLAVVEALLKAGADAARATTDGRTALHLAAQNGHTAVVEALLKAGADPNSATSSESDETYGTAEELDAFLDRLLERGDQLKKEIEEVAARIHQGVPA
jgi:cytohesin